VIKIKFRRISYSRDTPRKNKKMVTTGGGCRDLRKYMNDKKTQEIFGLLISGKKGYIPVEERRVEPRICSGCKIELAEDQKFCHECGTKFEKPVAKPEEQPDQ
jgi:hypothetical protein